MIHSTAIVSPLAKIGKNVSIGAYSIIGDEVELADNVEIMSHVCVDGRVTIGEGTRIFPFATIGYQPQDLKYHGEKSCVIIGKNNSIREYVTIHPGTEGGLMKTVVGDNNLLMIGVHIAHDCVVGNHVVMGNNATLGGHVVVGNNVIIGGLSAVHQFVRIGHHAIIGGMSGVERDVVPFGAVKGDRAHLYGLNLIGMRRAEFHRDEISALQKAYDVIFCSEGSTSDKLKTAEEQFGNAKCVSDVISFMREETSRSFCMPKESKCSE